MTFENFFETATVEIIIDTYRQQFELEKQIITPGVPIAANMTSPHLPSTYSTQCRIAEQLINDEQGLEMVKKMLAYEAFKALENLKAKKGIVAETWRFPNDMVVTVGYDNNQIPELQGPYTYELLLKIKSRSDDFTKWNGFY